MSVSTFFEKLKKLNPTADFVLLPRLAGERYFDDCEFRFHCIRSSFGSVFLNFVTMVGWPS